MRGFFKIFFASLLSLIVFCLILLFVFIGFISSLASEDKPNVPNKSVLVLNLEQRFPERSVNDPLAVIYGEETDVPGLYDVVRLIHHAKTDDRIAGIYIDADGNANGFAASEEIRNALIDFKTSKKPVIAYGEMMSENAYFVASVANKIYANPVGTVEWNGFSSSLLFLKGTLDKLNIQPQIFYAGKFKSATEPLRATEMTPENELQTIAWLGDLYDHFLQSVSKVRGVDTGTLHALANNGAVQTPQDAVKNRLIDAVKYDDEIKAEWKKHLKLDKYDKLSMVPVNKYAEAASFKKGGKDKIALVYAEGNIIDGKGDNELIGSEDYVKLIRRVRLDKSIKAIVFRVNSGGGSALASENIWRELELAKQDKPVVVSFGDVAASGGYYIAAGADSIFASANTITGSIGVFTIIPNMEGFFNNQLGITFDDVKTSPYATERAIYRPMNEAEKNFTQQSVDRIYLTFKQRVAKGRKKAINYIDSIAQGRVWSGVDAVQNGLVDKIGGLQDAVSCAARLAKTTDYRLREYPEKEGWMQSLLNDNTPSPEVLLKQKMGEQNYTIYKQVVGIKEMCNTAQAKLPFQFFIQ